MTTDRLQAIRNAMQGANVRTALFVFPENIRYLTGYTGEGALLLDETDAQILTDFRYMEQAAREAPACALVETRTMPECVGGLLSAKGCQQLWVETGVLTVSVFRALQTALPNTELMDLPPLAETLRMVKDEHEIACIIRASEIACRAFEELLGILKPGMTERDVQLALDYRMLHGGAEAVAFKTIACAGLNGSLPHATPGEHKIAKGELLTLDFGAQVKGYKTDMTRTVAIGQPCPALVDLYETVRHAQEAALEALDVGKTGREVDAVARGIIDQQYEGRFGHGLGHGVGLCIHEKPNLSVRSDDVLAPGHVVTVEPGIYIEGLGGCRIEDTVILRKRGFVNAISAPKQLITL